MTEEAWKRVRKTQKEDDSWEQVIQAKEGVIEHLLCNEGLLRKREGE